MSTGALIHKADERKERGRECGRDSQSDEQKKEEKKKERGIECGRDSQSDEHETTTWFVREKKRKGNRVWER